jgi:Protein of unknown function (DUF3341)
MSMHSGTSGTLFEFETPEQLLAAADAARELGFEQLDAFTPYPIPELDEKLRLPRSRIPVAVFLAALTGCLVAYWILWFTNARDYPLDVGGRPLNSIPADIPIMFETTVLFGSITAFFAVLLLSRMPRLFHPIMTVEGHESITIDRFWLGIADNSRADVRVDDAVRARMVDLGALAVRTMSAEP